MQIRYAQQVREYTLSVLPAILMIWAFDRFISSKTWVSAGSLAVIVCVSLFAQYGLALLNLSLNFVFLLHFWKNSRNKDILLMWVAVQAIALVVVIIVSSTTLQS